MKRLSLRNIALALVGILLLALAVREIAIALRSDETRVKLVLADVERCARERDPGGVLEYIDPDYSDEQGFTRAVVRPIVGGYFMRAKSIDCESTPVSEVVVDGDIARVRVRASVALKVGAKPLTFRDAGFRGDLFEVDLQRHKHYFRCISVRVARPGEDANVIDIEDQIEAARDLLGRGFSLETDAPPAKEAAE